MKVGLLIISTNKYVDFLQQLITSADQYFLTNHEVTYYVFSNLPIDVKTDREVVVTQVKHEKWPWMTLGRYKIFSDNSHKYDVDYLYYCDVDMKFVGEVGDEILSDMVATQHPMYYNSRGTPETNPLSRSFINNTEYMEYFVGGFNGGLKNEYLKMSKKILKDIEVDFSNGVIAVRHDESHMNRYFIDNKPTKVLSPSYCYVESIDIPFEKKLVSLFIKNENDPHRSI